LSFTTVQLKKRVVQRVAGGVMTFGATPPPIVIYQGLTARRDIKAADAACRANGEDRHPGHVDADREGKSIGNVNRGDKI
jgi:hypothetical protein